MVGEKSSTVYNGCCEELYCEVKFVVYFLLKVVNGQASWPSGLSCYLGCLHPTLEFLGSSHALTSDPASCWGIWEVANDGHSIWVPATHVRDPDGVCDSWLWPSPVLAVEGF